VFFDTANSGHVTHVGVYAGKGQFAHASTAKGVVYADLDARWCKDVYRGARRVLAYPAPRESSH
jgi:cell wall-associated NlpC family hydrolase